MKTHSNTMHSRSTDDVLIKYSSPAEPPYFRHRCRKYTLPG
jgi:hypothetical protein